MSNEWQPIESAPKDGTWVLGWRDGWDAPHAMRFRVGWSNECGHVSPGPTQWHALPEPPK